MTPFGLFLIIPQQSQLLQHSSPPGQVINSRPHNVPDSFSANHIWVSSSRKLVANYSARLYRAAVSRPA